jgi:site-specific DNA recombinase
MNRAAREGRYTGGIVAFGYRVEGQKATGRLVPDRSFLWADRSAADLVREMYERVALRSQSCRMIALDFNAMGVPTHYVRDGREVEYKQKGLRKARTQGLWRAGRIRNLLVNPVYKGLLIYGRRTAKLEREKIPAQIESLVSAALWQAAQDALAANRRCAKNSGHVYLMRGVIRCGICGLTFVGSMDRWGGRYRCNGELVERGPIVGRCPSCSVKVDAVEPVVWADVERFLRDPGDVLDDLDADRERDAEGAVAAAESITLGRALDTLEADRQRAVSLVVRGVLTEADLVAELERTETGRAELGRRLDALRATASPELTQEAVDALTRVRERLDAGLSAEERAEIVKLLVRAVVYTDVDEDGKKHTRIALEYRFPTPTPLVVPTRTGTDSHMNYTIVRRVIELPVGRQVRSRVVAQPSDSRLEREGCRAG